MSAFKPATQPKLSTAVSALQKLYPPQTLIHVGAGSGVGPLHQWHNWNIANAWLIDADGERLAWANSHQPETGHWHLLTALIANETSEQPYHVASNPDESGMLQPELLQKIWPQLKTKSVEQRSTQTLERLLEDAGALPSDHWLIVDCLPALDILQTAGNWLQTCNVIWIRALLQPIKGVESNASLGTAQEFLAEIGFSCVEVQESNHPAVGYALFVRDWRQALCQAQQGHSVAIRAGEQAMHDLTRSMKVLEDSCRDERSKSEALRAEIEAQSKTHLELVTATADLKAQLEQAIKGRDEQAKVVGELKAQVESVSKSCTEQTKLAVDQKAQLDLTTKSRDEHAKLAQDRQAQIEQLSKDKDAQSKLVSDTKAQLEQVTTQRDEQAKLAADCKVQLDAAIKSCNEKNKFVQDRQAQVEQLSEFIDAQTKLANDSKVQLDQVTNACDEQTNLAQQRLAQLEQLHKDLESQGKLLSDSAAKLQQMTKAKDEQVQIAADLKLQIDKLSSARDELLAAQEQVQRLAARVKESDEQLELADNETAQIRRELAEANMKLDAMTADVSERDVRQQMLKDEIIRAEAQIDLIKDILLREPGL